MQRMKNIKIWIGIIYLILLCVFLYFLFSKFSIEEITTYNFIKSNSEYLINFREQNLPLVSICFILLGILWILAQGFGSPLVLASGFLFGSYLGTIIVILTLSLGSTLIYIFANFFFKDLIREKFLNKFKNLETRFRNKELTYMILYRFIGGIPMQLQNLIPCMFSVSTKNFFIGSIIGFFPQAFIFSSLGSGLENQIKKNSEPPSFVELVTSFEIYGPILGFFFLLVLVFVVKNLLKKN
tara:strand:- start:795 stop:1514 length:720 start_codon:yes stop_codon:yes gene_type:complete